MEPRALHGMGSMHELNCAQAFSSTTTHPPSPFNIRFQWNDVINNALLLSADSID